MPPRRTSSKDVVYSDEEDAPPPQPSVLSTKRNAASKPIKSQQQPKKAKATSEAQTPDFRGVYKDGLYTDLETGDVYPRPAIEGVLPAHIPEKSAVAAQAEFKNYSMTIKRLQKEFDENAAALEVWNEKGARQRQILQVDEELSSKHAKKVEAAQQQMDKAQLALDKALQEQQQFEEENKAHRDKSDTTRSWLNRCLRGIDNAVKENGAATTRFVKACEQLDFEAQEASEDDQDD